MSDIQIAIEGVDSDELPEDIELDLDEMIYRQMVEGYGIDIEDVTVETKESE